MAHKFMVGQAVDLTPTTIRLAATGDYEIRRLIPAPDSDPENPCYRVKNIEEKYERIVRESEITLSRRQVSIFT
jgi:hypothetical protein